jgi:hypothetical protein
LQVLQTKQLWCFHIVTCFWLLLLLASIFIILHSVFWLITLDWVCEWVLQLLKCCVRLREEEVILPEEYLSKTEY